MKNHVVTEHVVLQK